MPESQQQTTPQKSQSNGDSSPGSVSTDSRLTPPESQSPLHWLADLAEQKAIEEKQGNQLLKLEFKGSILMLTNPRSQHKHIIKNKNKKLERWLSS